MKTSIPKRLSSLKNHHNTNSTLICWTESLRSWHRIVTNTSSHGFGNFSGTTWKSLMLLSTLSVRWDDTTAISQDWRNGQILQKWDLWWVYNIHKGYKMIRKYSMQKNAKASTRTTRAKQAETEGKCYSETRKGINKLSLEREPINLITRLPLGKKPADIQMKTKWVNQPQKKH